MNLNVVVQFGFHDDGGDEATTRRGFPSSTLPYADNDALVLCPFLSLLFLAADSSASRAEEEEEGDFFRLLPSCWSSTVEATFTKSMARRRN
jgi:hypothetical protein